VHNDGNLTYSVRVLLATGTPGEPRFAEPVTWYTNPAGWADWNLARFVAGDFDGDRKLDIGSFYQYPSCQSKLWVHYATGSAFQQGSLVWDSGVNNFCWDRMDPVTGDFDGDGRTDAATFYRYDGCQSIVWAWYGNADRTVTSPTPKWGSGGNSWCADKVERFAGDVDGDGRADLAAVYRCCGAYQAKLYTLTAGADRTFAAPQMRWEGGVGPFSVGSVRVDTAAKYQIVNVNSGKCLTAPGGDGVQLVQRTCGTGGDATFRVERSGAAFVNLHPVQAPASCVDLRGASQNVNTPIQLWSCGAGNTAQMFTLGYAGGFTDPILAVGVYASGQCFDIPGAATGDNVGVVQYLCNGTVAQQFHLRPVA
jgi:hypothetical protein